MNTPDRIANWLDWLSIDAAASTCDAYRWELRHVEAWALATLDRDVMSLTKDDLARYLAQRRAIDGVGDATIRRSINALRAFYKYALGGKSPAKSIKPKSVKRKKQRSLTWEQVDALLLACDTSTARGRRDLALVCLLLDSGLREAEACRLLVADVVMEERRLTVQVKGGNDGDGIFSRDTQAALSAWLAIRPLYARPEVGNFFVSVGGLLPGTAITPSGMRTIFRRLGRAAGFERFSPHDLRRSFATLSSKLGVPSRVLQVAGRWEDIQMVVRYTPTIEADDFERYSPVSHALKPKP